jgi:hypothetical protein
VKAYPGVLPDLGHHRRDAIADLLEDERTGRVDHVHALAAGIDHDAGLLGQDFGLYRVRHHQEADGLQVELARKAEVLDGDVGLGRVGGDPDHRHPDLRGRGDVVHTA